MNAAYAKKLEARTRIYREQLDQVAAANPFGVPIATGGWAGNGEVIRFAITNYALHKAFPRLVDRESVLSGLNYIYG